MTMSETDSKVYNAAFVRIWQKEKAIGAGILVGDKSKPYILTCAHVVVAALNRDYTTLDPEPAAPASDPIPNQSILIDFPEIDLGKKLQAQVKWWQRSEQPLPERGKDIAILTLLDNTDNFSTDKILPLKLKQKVGDLVQDLVSFRGFPDSGGQRISHSMPSQGKFGNESEGKREIFKEDGTPFSPQRGFSGSPLWDNHIHEVVGIFTAAYKAQGISWMIPNEVISVSIPSLYKKLLFESTPSTSGNGSGKKIDPLYEPIIREFKVGHVIPVLGPGINPLIYIDLANRLIEKVGREVQGEREWDTSDEDRKRELRQELIQQIIGLPCSACHQITGYRPENCPIVGHIIDPQNIGAEILYLEQELVIAKMNLRYFSQALQAESSEVLYDKLRGLYNKDKEKKPWNFIEIEVMVMPRVDINKLRNVLAQIAQSMKLENVVNLIKRTDFDPLQIHNFFAEIPALMNNVFPLIITTNYDNWLEKAFIYYNSEQPFDVIFFDSCSGQFVHQPWKGSVSLISQENNLKQLFERRGLQKKIFAKRPIILKLFGDWNFADDGCQFAINEYQFNSLLRCLKDLPQELQTILKNKDRRLLFIGFSPNDYELQLLVNRLREDEMINTSDSAGESWLIHQDKTGKLAGSLWVKRKVKLISTSSFEDFISQLKTGIQQG